MSYWIYRFGSLQLPLYNASQDISTGQARTAYIDLPSGGRFDQYSSGIRSPLSPRTIKYKATIGTDSSSTAGMTAWHNLHTSLRKMVGLKDKLYRIKSSDNSIQYVYARCTGIDVSRDYPKNRYMIDISADFELDDSLWLSTDNEPWNFDTGYLFDTPSLNFDQIGASEFTINSNPFTFTIDASTSEIEIKSLKFEIYPISTGNSFTNIKIENLTNGMWFQYTGTVSYGSTLSVNNKSQSVRVNSTDAYAGFSYGSSQMDWMQLNAVSNSFKVTLTGLTGTAKLKIFWADLYL